MAAAQGFLFSGVFFLSMAMHIIPDDSTTRLNSSKSDLAEILAQARSVIQLEVPQPSRSYVTIGVFDGVHRGHQQLIGRMTQSAHSTQDLAVVINFDPHPAITLGYPPPPLLTTVDTRARLLAALGVDVLVVLPFTQALAHTSATDFVEALMRYLRLAELWGGPDLALGHRREGDVPFLRRLGAERGFGVRVVEPLVWEGAVVSSSRVRAALRAGDIRQATGCLGRPYRLAGVVIPGDGRGHRIGIPTANISPPPGRLIPAGGIYACLAHTQHRGTHLAVVNIGTRPTFARDGLVIEAHLLDFNADLYDQMLVLDFVARLRDERAFSGPDALVKQIHDDIVRARLILDDFGVAVGSDFPFYVEKA
jgi:riboflavin kinase/FMN adenylyltransferase